MCDPLSCLELLYTGPIEQKTLQLDRVNCTDTDDGSIRPEMVRSDDEMSDLSDLSVAA